ncbi:MAG: hypothetical protein ACRCUS_05355 [Anaerovoracaceae bacterium]
MKKYFEISRKLPKTPLQIVTILGVMFILASLNSIIIGNLQLDNSATKIGIFVVPALIIIFSFCLEYLFFSKKAKAKLDKKEFRLYYSVNFIVVLLMITIWGVVIFCYS